MKPTRLSPRVVSGLDFIVWHHCKARFGERAAARVMRAALGGLPWKSNNKLPR